MRRATVKCNNISIFNNLQIHVVLDKGMSELLHSLFTHVWQCEVAPLGCGHGSTGFSPRPPGETMKQEYFVVVLAHSLRGRLRRVHVPHQAVYAILAFALLGCFSFF